VVKINQLLSAVRVEEPILLPLEDGEVLTIAGVGDFVLWDEEKGFLKVVDAVEFAEKWTVV
jgi:hypothetical protein